MKLTNHFSSFLADTVNLNVTRIDDLDGSVTAIKNFLRQSTYEPRIRSFAEQGSWAHGTIIKPVDQGEFDADLVMFLDPVDDWTASDYVKELGRVLKASVTYGQMTKVWEYCVTITYAKAHKVDIAPCIVDRVFTPSKEVCNKKTDEFENSEPVAFTRWLRDQNGYSGNNSFRKVTRLAKYLRDIKLTFSCPSVILTTLLGNNIHSWDKGGVAFADTPTALKTLFGRLDDWLQARPAKPAIHNPELWGEDFAAEWSDDKYTNFRKQIARYREWIDDAYDCEDRDESITKWRRVFGNAFAKGVTIQKKSLSEATALASVMVAKAANYTYDLVKDVRLFGVGIVPREVTHPDHQQPIIWTRSSSAWFDITVFAQHRSRQRKEGVWISAGQVIQPNGGLLFTATINGEADVPQGHYLKWRITNTGWAAFINKSGRGGFYSSDGCQRWEPLEYHGVHIAEAFMIGPGDTLCGQSAPFHVVID